MRLRMGLVSRKAFANGFNDSNYFSRQFRAFFGLSPRQYRCLSMRKS